MTKPVEVIAGPAGSGKTELLLGHYRAEFARGATASCLWLAPTHRAAVEVRRCLLASGLGGCLEPRVMTFEQLAEQVIAKSRDVVRPIDRLVQRRILAQLIADALASERLNYFRKVAETGSLVNLASEWIVELKRLEIWPDQFEAACAARGLEPRDRELVDLYRRYQAHLTQHGLYDVEGCIWSARSYLQEEGARLLGDLRLVVADGFADFTRTQHEILQALADPQQFPQSLLYVSLPLETATKRPHLFHKSQATLGRLREYHQTANVEYQERNTTRLWPTLSHIEAHLFASPHDQQPVEEPIGVEILAAESDLGEIELVGRRIKRLLFAGDESGHQVKPQQIAVVFRAAAPAAGLVREVFGELGIPYALETPRRLGDARVMSALVTLLEFVDKDWPYRALLGVLGSNYMRWTADDHALCSSERIIRHLQIPQSRKKLLEQVTRLAELALDEASEDSRLRDYVAWSREALPVLRRLADLLDVLPTRATLSEWHTHIETLAAQIGMIAAMQEEAPGADAATDCAAWETLANVVGASEKADSWSGQSPPMLSLAEFIRMVTDFCESESLNADRDDTGRVRVLSAASIRGITVDYLFVAGLSEKSFPSLGQQEALYSADDYGRLRQRGLPLADHTERSREEMLLFYEVITRAARRLWLTYAALDAKGQPLSASPYVTEVERACGTGRLAHSSEIRLSPVPAEPMPLGNREWRLMAAARALDHDAPDMRLLAAHGSDSALRLPHANLLAGLGVVAERQSGKTFGAYEGMLLESAATRVLQQRFGPDKLWSATELEEYGLCPHRFFLNHVLGVEEPEELSLDIDFGARGRALHETLARAHRYLNDRAGKLQSPCELGGAERTAFQAELLEMLRDTVAGLPAASEAERALLEVNRREIERWVLAYFEQHEAYDKAWKDAFDEPPRPAHFEVAFGTKQRKGDDAELSTSAPFEILLAGEKFKLSGRIDRIDVGQIAGRAVFNIIDYKTGKARPPTLAEVDGTSLQLELYAMATQELLLAEEHALPWRAGYWLVRDRGFHKPLELSEADDEARASEAWLAHRAAIIERLASVVRGIRAGQFPMASAQDDCTSRCAYHTVCRVHQTRNLGKQWQV